MYFNIITYILMQERSQKRSHLLSERIFGYSFKVNVLWT